MKSRLIVASIMLVVVGCTSGQDDAAAFREATDSLRRLIGDVRPADFAALSDGIRMGAEEGAADDVFGLIVDAARTKAGHTLVLDERLHKLVLFDSVGRRLGQVGGPGRGPGEYRSVRSLDSDGETIRVLDRGNRKVVEYGLEGDSLRLTSERRVPSLADDFCVLGEDLFLLSGRSGDLVMRLDSSGDVSRRFGEVPSFEHVPEGPLRNAARGTMSGGRIVCIPERDLVVVAYRFLPDVKAFTSDGQLVWESSLRDHLALEVQVVDLGGQPGTTYAAADETGLHHMTAGLQVVGNKLVVQLALLDWIHREPGSREVDTRWLSITTGEEEGRTLALPLLGSPKDGGGVAFINMPFPQAMTIDLQAFIGALR